MSKWIKRSTSEGKFTVGRASAEKFSAVEGQARSERTARLIELSDARGEVGDIRRARIVGEFTKRH